MNFECFIICFCFCSDSSWQSWGSWSGCSISCGGEGVKTRWRLCGKENGTGSESCRGNSSQVQSCRPGSCVGGREGLLIEFNLSKKVSLYPKEFS